MADNGASCQAWDLGCRGQEALNKITGDALQNLADLIIEGFGKVVASLGTFWVNVDTPALLAANGKASSEVAFLQSSLWFWTLSLAVMAVLIGAGRMIYEQRGEPLRQIVVALVRFILVSAGGVTAIQLLIVASDGLAEWLIDESTNGVGFGESLLKMISLTGPLGVFLLIIFGIVAILVSGIQLVLMVLRSGLLVVLAGIFPTAAAFTNTEMGKQWFQRCVGWIIAFILYKPAAALVYATAFKLTAANNGDSDDVIKVLTGIGLMVIALIALPALMRFVTPMVGAVASGGGGGGAGMGAMAGSLASGAISNGARSSGRSSGGGGGSQKSSSQSTSSQSTSSTSKTTKGASGSTSGPTGGKSSAGADMAGAMSSGAKGAAAAGSGAAAGGAAASGGAAAGASGAAAGVAGGPAGMAVVAGAKVAGKAAKAGADAASGATQSSTGEGPSGSKG
ncbi:hypothetical protein [Pseudarthrobacter sp. PS3-L1]|uniref:hypothetical protein n=1 Tax=Pseudarthrobacter sp. PS3-L1 TaxID=3046207 RepID=UPI0024B893E0|nr:hypothetical protein [Pseudarthrobacter sp. PS3-L1]MDJ0322121.1 hypothetical protein [Pseudarthrobacter sp. PS3-L1]